MHQKPLSCCANENLRKKLWFFPCIYIDPCVFYTISLVPDRDIWSQLASSTLLSGFKSNVEICIAVYIILVLFVLFLLVMCILGNLQVLTNLGLWIYTLYWASQAQPGQARPTAWEARQGVPSQHGKGGYWISLLLETGQDGLIHSSTFNAVAAQVCLNKQRLASFPVNDIIM